MSPGMHQILTFYFAYEHMEDVDVANSRLTREMKRHTEHVAKQIGNRELLKSDQGELFTPDQGHANRFLQGELFKPDEGHANRKKD